MEKPRLGLILIGLPAVALLIGHRWSHDSKPDVVVHRVVRRLMCALAPRAVAPERLPRPIKDEFYGDRVAALRDPFGHRWTFYTRIEDVSVDEMKRRMAQE